MMRCMGVLLVMCLLITVARSGEPEKPKAEGAKLVVAVLPSQATAPELSELAKVLPSLLATALGRNEKLDLVEREQLDKVLSEHELNLSGVVDPDRAAQIGRLAGAKILIASKAYLVDRQAYVTANVINVETGRVRAATKVSGAVRPAVSDMAAQLADEIGKILETSLSAPAVAEDQKLKEALKRMTEALGNEKRPVVTVIVPEEHLRRAVPAPVPDPAVTSQLGYVMRKLKFTLIENDSSELEKWVADYFAGKSGKFPVEAVKVDVVVYGAAFSEQAGVRGNLHSVRARVELTAIDVKTGEIVAVNRSTASAADISENIAGKTALERAALNVMEEFLTDLVKDWNAVKKK